MHTVDPERFRGTIDPVRALDPTTIFSTHLPAARGLNLTLLDMLHQAPESPPFVGPDQAALEAMLATFQPELPPVAG
ncbi:MAG TPA: hypothetical protein VFG72_04865 [Marmoricola sp.]|nr:hypothetical protein [Marmoricola sp.]